MLDTAMSFLSQSFVVIIIVLLIFVILICIPFLKMAMESDDIALQLIIIACSALFFTLVFYGLYKGTIDMKSIQDEVGNIFSGIKSMISKIGG